VAGEIALGSFGNTSSTPCDQYALGETAVGVLDLCECELDATFAKILNEVGELAIYILVSREADKKGVLVSGIPPVLWTFRMLSLAPLSWKAFIRGAWTVKRAQ
jgi:hypothetical protein